MIWVAIFLFIFSAFLVFLLYVIQKVNNSEDIIPAAVLGACIFAFVVIGLAILDDVYNPSIKPMDVYKGKTTLKYEVVDGVKVDSTVVWKEEVK